MSTIEERVQALEQEHTALKKTIELQTIAIGALVNKATLEKLNEKHDKLFEAPTNHDQFINGQLAELRNQQDELDGKVVGMQTEMRQRFIEQDGKIVGVQTEMRQRFTELDNKATTLDNKVTGLQTTQAEHTTLLQQILSRLPEKP